MAKLTVEEPDEEMFEEDEMSTFLTRDFETYATIPLSTYPA